MLEVAKSFAIAATFLSLLHLSMAQRPIIRGFTMMIGNCAEMFLNEEAVKADIQTCANECMRYTGCRGFSFDHLEQDCWLKWGICDKLKPTRLTRVVFYKNELWGFSAEPGSCPGQLAVPPVFTDVIACASKCRTMANCSGFTYDFEGDVCYLKAQVCQRTVPSEMLAVESWVKYFRKDFWVPAALERTRKFLNDDDPEATNELFAQQQADQPQHAALRKLQDTSNPLEMVFFDNQNAPMDSETFPLPAVLGENDPWEAYANPSEGADYVAVAEGGVRMLIHRATIANASEAACSRACTLDSHCSYFYLLRTEVTMVISNNKPNSTAKEVKTKSVKQQNCVLFSKWNATSVMSKRRSPGEGKLFQKVAHEPRTGPHSHVSYEPTSLPDRQPYPSPFDFRPSPITLISLRKRKRHVEGQDKPAPTSSASSSVDGCKFLLLNLLFASLCLH